MDTAFALRWVKYHGMHATIGDGGRALAIHAPATDRERRPVWIVTVCRTWADVSAVLGY